jgi:hypothetical protein
MDWSGYYNNFPQLGVLQSPQKKKSNSYNSDDGKYPFNTMFLQHFSQSFSITDKSSIKAHSECQ